MDFVTLPDFLYNLNSYHLVCILERIISPNIKGCAFKIRDSGVSVHQFDRCVSVTAFMYTVIDVHYQDAASR